MKSSAKLRRISYSRFGETINILLKHSNVLKKHISATNKQLAGVLEIRQGYGKYKFYHWLYLFNYFSFLLGYAVFFSHISPQRLQDPDLYKNENRLKRGHF